MYNFNLVYNNYIHVITYILVMFYFYRQICFVHFLPKICLTILVNKIKDRVHICHYKCITVF